MPKALGDDLGVDAGLQGQGGVGMAQVMQADARQHRLLDRLPPVATDALRVEGAAGLRRNDSATNFTVLVTPKVTLKLSGLTHGVLKLGKRVTAKGTVTPASLAGGKVSLTVQHKLRGKWRKVKSVARTISASGTYSCKYKPSKKGGDRVKVTIAKTAANTAATTKWRTFKVK
jgi:hypothetical protein